jgi:hypothetical protein
MVTRIELWNRGLFFGKEPATRVINLADVFRAVDDHEVGIEIRPHRTKLY